MKPNEDQKELVKCLATEGITKPDGVKWSIFLNKRLVRLAKTRPNLAQTILSLTDFLPTLSLTERARYLLLGYTKPLTCLNCGTVLIIRAGNTLQFCSTACSNSNFLVKERKKATNQRNLGVDYPQQSSMVRERTKQNNLQKYGVDHPHKLQSVVDATKNTNLSIYGCTCSLHAGSVKEKTRASLLHRYGDTHSWGSKSTARVKSLDTLQSRYGVTNPSHSKEILVRTQATNTLRYNVPWVVSSALVREKSEKTLLQRYGVANIMRLPRVAKIVGIKSRRTRLANNWDSRIKLFKEAGITPLFSFHDFVKRGGIYKDNSYIKYKFQCDCDNIFETWIGMGRVPRCPTCYPSMRGTSKGEEEVAAFLADYTTVERHNRSVLNGQELDIYLPEYNMAVEYNGNYWHSQIGGNKERYYHQKKALACYESGVKLFSIFSDQWEQKQELICSMLLQRLKRIDTCVGARKCKIVSAVNSKTASTFFNENHLFGAVSGLTKGLEYEGQLVAALSIGKSRYDKAYSHELLRFAVKQKFSVQGGLSRLLNAFSVESLVCYADASFSTGTAYELVGFNRVGITAPGYYYLDRSYSHRYSRQQFQKHKLQGKLEHYLPERSEWENMQLNGYDRVWDCGNWVFAKPSQ